MTDPAQEIRDLRESTGLSQVAFAELLGTTQPTVSRWESGATTPPTAVLRAARHLIGRKRKARDEGRAA